MLQIISLSNSTSEINERPEIKSMSVIILNSKSTNTKRQRPIIIELDYNYQAQEKLKTLKK